MNDSSSAAAECFLARATTFSRCLSLGSDFRCGMVLMGRALDVGLAVSLLLYQLRRRPGAAVYYFVSGAFQCAFSRSLITAASQRQAVPPVMQRWSKVMDSG